MTSAAIRLVGVGNRAASLKVRFPDAVLERGDIVLRSPLRSSASLNDHLVFLWRLLKRERPFLKKIQQEGIKLICHCKVGKGPAVLRPNATEMLHLLGADLVLELR